MAMEGEGSSRKNPFAGLLSGLTEFVDKLNQLAEKGQELTRSGSFDLGGAGQGQKPVRGVYGLSVKMGLGGEGPTVEPFGNIRRDRETGEPVVEGDRIRAALFGSRNAGFNVIRTEPREAVVIHRTTELFIAEPQKEEVRVEEAAARAAMSYEDIGGLKETKQRLVEAVEWPLRHEALFDQAQLRPPKGILLSGPPGCGKTLLAKAIATEGGLNFLSVKGAALLSKYVGESERAVREIFPKARQAAPCIIFFDELDALIPRRSGGAGDSHVSERVVSQFLTELDGVEDLKGVLVLGATNRPDILDPAVLRPGRFDAIVEVDLPNEADRAKILSVHLRGKPLAEEVDVTDLTKKTDGMSGADLALICDQAALMAIRRTVRSLEREAGRGEPRPMVTIDQGDLGRALAMASRARGRTAG